jgi:B12-binding domain/radical SAM domain protein
MHINWRNIHSARNSYATLSAACAKNGFSLCRVDRPSQDITCYSLNSISEPQYRDEIAAAGCITIVGGPHATACPSEVAEYADFVVVGEGEYTLPCLLHEIESGKSGKIPGVVTRDFSRKADTSVLLDSYPAFSEVQGYVEISRGCPFSCGYCQTPQIYGHCIRHRSIEAITKYSNRYEHSRFVTPNAFAYGSDGVHPRWDKIEKLFKRLNNTIYFGTFPSEVRPEFVCEESLSLITSYCANTKLHFGAQSGSNAVLEHLRRGHTTEDVIHAVEQCTATGITPVVDFIIGLPFETDVDQQDTINLIRWISRFGKVHVHKFIPLPGTSLAGTTARSLLTDTEKTLGNLALSGRVTGSWDDPAVRFFRRPSNDIP